MSEHIMYESQLKLKRMRGKNFNEREKELLIDLVLPFKPIIENVKTDAVWNNKKAEVWSEITSLYNLQQTSGIRIESQLKNLYDTLKRDARKEKSNDKVQMYKTGGGSNINNLTKTTEKIIGLLGDQMNPLINSVDSDSNYNDGGFEVVNLFSEDITDLQDSRMPKFGEDLNNVTVPVGREAKFVCNVEGLATYKVAWLRVDTQTILTIHSHVITKNHRIAVTHSDHRIWYLHIRDVREADRGWYMCQINTDPMKSQQGYLQVVVPPDILDYPTSTDMVVREGGNVSMQCAASGFPNPSITWRKEGGQSICLNPNTEVSAVNGPWLNVSKVNRLHMGAYLCIASNGIPPSVSKRIMLIIQFPPMIWIQNQLVGAQEGQSVTLECTSEAFPKSIDYWTKDKTTIISNGTKYFTDLKDNVYKTYMKLTIISVTLSDYGTYQCVSKNSLGDTDGTIKLYAVPKPTTTTTTTTTTAPTTTTTTTTTTKMATTMTGGWWTTEVPKKSSKFGGKAPANEVDRRPSKKTGKHQDAEAASNKKDDPTEGDQQQSSRAAAAAAAAAGDNNGRPALSKKHKNGSASVHPALGVTAAVWIIITQRIFPL